LAVHYTNLGSFPYVLRVFAILLDNRKDAGCDNSVGFAEVVVNFWEAGVSIWELP
jgi:hypothetical protein